MKKLTLTTIVIIIFLSGCSGCLYSCMHPIQYEGAYKGKVVDSETGQPIEGVVVLGTWSKVYPNVAGAWHEYYDARETVTDKDGEFVIRGMGVKLFSNVEPMDALIFKAGYEYVQGSWRSFKIGLYSRDKVKWEGEKAMIPLRRLTILERSKSDTFPPYPPTGVSNEKSKWFMMEIYKERKERGLN